MNRWLELLGAVRFDRFSTRYQDPANATVANRDVSRTDNMTSWRVGAVLHPTETSSIYVVTGNSFNPSAELATLASTGTTSSAQPPEENRT